jgi:hypothetical protein
LNRGTIEQGTEEQEIGEQKNENRASRNKNDQQLPLLWRGLPTEASAKVWAGVRSNRGTEEGRIERLGKKNE